MLFCWRPSLAGKATLVGVAAFILLAAFVFFRTGCGYVPLHPSGSFTIGGEAKSRFIGLVHSDRYGSWSGSDRNVGVLTSDAFRAPAALTFFVAGYPSHPNEEVSVTRLDTHEFLRLFTPSHPTGPDPQRTWAIFYVGLPSSWRGVQIQLVVRDNGRGSDDWVGIASLRAARLDEWMLAAPVDTPWAYVGFGYIALIFYGFSRLIGPIGKLVRDPWYLGVTFVVATIAYRTGWTNVDLSGWFANWGRNALHLGPASLYDAPWRSDNPPLNPAMMVFPAFLEALLRTNDPHVVPFLYKLLPISGLFVLPFLARAALLATGVDVDGRFRVLVLATVANPAFVYGTAIWGQSDVFVCDFILASVIAFLRMRSFAGSSFFVAGVLTKPQPILAVPIIAALALRSGRPWRVVAGVVFGLLAVLPSTYPHGGFYGGYLWLWSKFMYAANEFRYATMGAGTMPALLVGDGLIEDSASRFGLSVHVISLACVVVALVVLFVSAWRERAQLRSALCIWYLAVSCMSVYWFATHMHERYITYAAVFSIAWAFARRNRRATMACTCLSFALFVQMTANWTIDLGWPKNVMDTLTSFAPHAFYFDVSVTLNILGLLLLLWSRVPYPVTPSPIETLFRRKPTLSRAKNAG